MLESPTYVAALHPTQADWASKSVSIEDSQETICATAHANYKVQDLISMYPANATEVTMILNRGAGLSTLATRALPDGSQSAIIQKKSVGLRVADGNPIRTNGYVLL